METNTAGQQKVEAGGNKVWNNRERDVCSFWSIKKFECVLRGRKFKLVMDHKPLEEI